MRRLVGPLIAVTLIMSSATCVLAQSDDARDEAVLVAGIDFKNLGLIPIGAQLMARTSSVTNGSADLASRSWLYGIGLFYTGWDDFSLSFEASMNTLDRRDVDDDFESFVGTFNVRYWP